MNIHNGIADVVIVGAGPYGLSLASHLKQRGIEFRIFGVPMENWQNAMPKGMFLKSEGSASSLSDIEGRWTLRSYCSSRNLPYRNIGLPVSLETFVKYGLAFQQELVPELEHNKVVALRQGQGVFHVRLDTGEETLARSVVIAVGTTYFGYVPQQFAGLPSELVSHSCKHCDFVRFSRASVVVIGGGQSALETAALLHEQGAEVRVLVREPMLFWNPTPQEKPSPLWKALHPASPLGAGWKTWFYSNYADIFRLFPQQLRASIVRSALGPAGAWWLKDRVCGRFPLSLGYVVERAVEKGGKTLLSVVRPDGSVEEICADHVIAATGYKVNVRSLPFIDKTLLSQISTYDGAPILSPSFESSIPGLYFTGLAAAQRFGPSMRFVAGTDYAARKISRACRVSLRSDRASKELKEPHLSPQSS